MTPTSDERREVAERLRKLSAHGQSISCDAVDKALGIWYDDSYFGCVFAHESVLRLADLIDPTCEMEDAGDVPASVKDNLSTFFCSECGAPIYNDMSPSYCPYCGARVVSDDE